MHGVLKKDETIAEKFFCIPVCPKKHSLIADEEAKDPSQRCDGDHLFGRCTRYLNGIMFVQGVSHQENIIRHFVRGAINEWLHSLLVGVYKGGNTRPKEPARRV